MSKLAIKKHPRSGHVRGGRLHFELQPDFSPSQWQRGFETALGGVRPLRLAGTSLPLLPGNGNTRLRCARTSFGWDADGARCYLLIVEALDSEPAANYRKTHQLPQTGGFDLPQVQHYWERLGIPNAVIFDGGESTQFAYRTRHAVHFLPSGYLTSRTIGYLNHRPIRLFIPLLPPQFNHVGAMNYLYLAEK